MLYIYICIYVHVHKSLQTDVYRSLNIVYRDFRYRSHYEFYPGASFSATILACLALSQVNFTISSQNDVIGWVGEISSYIFFAWILQVIVDISEREILKIKPHVMKKPCSLPHPQVFGFGWISRKFSQMRFFWPFDDIVLCKKTLPRNPWNSGWLKYWYYSYYKVFVHTSMYRTRRWRKFQR